MLLAPWVPPPGLPPARLGELSASSASSSARAVSARADSWVRPDSHRLTVAKDTPSRRASCSWLSPRLLRRNRSWAATDSALRGSLTLAAYDFSGQGWAGLD